MKKVLTGMVIAPLFFVGVSVFAQGMSGQTGSGEMSGTTGGILDINTKLENPIKARSFSELIGMLISSVVYILSPFLVLAFVYVGFLFVQAQGNGTKLEEAKSAFLWTVVGAFILMSAWGLSKVLESTVKSLTN